MHEHRLHDCKFSRSRQSKRRNAHSTVASSLDDTLQLPPTPPTSNHGDSDGSLPPSSPHLPLPQSSPQPQHRPGGRASSSFSSSAISSSPLLTAPHVSEMPPFTSPCYSFGLKKQNGFGYTNISQVTVVFMDWNYFIFIPAIK